MKDYKKIMETIKGNRDAIECKHGQIEELQNVHEKRIARNAGDMGRLRTLAEASKAHEAEIISISEDIYRLKLENEVLLENSRASFIAHALEIIAAECSKYNGKQYGEKTKDKIQEAVREKGIGFYFSGIGTKDSIHIYAPDDEGYHRSGIDLEAELWAENGFPFVTADNKLNFDIDNVRQRYKYADKPAAQVDKIIKAYKAYQAAMEKASAAETALNELLPGTIGRYYNAKNVKPLI